VCVLATLDPDMLRLDSFLTGGISDVMRIAIAPSTWFQVVPTVTDGRIHDETMSHPAKRIRFREGFTYLSCL